VISAIFKIVASNPPSIAMAGGILLMLSGQTELGTSVFYTGAILQGLWLALKSGLLKK